MISLTGMRFFIEFSSILALVFLCIVHEFTDVTLAKQFNIGVYIYAIYTDNILIFCNFCLDHASNQASFDNVDSTSLHLSVDEEKPPHAIPTFSQASNQPFVKFTPESLEFGPQ